MLVGRPAWLRENSVSAWCFAIVAFLTALGVRFAIAEDVPYGIPFLTFFPAVILTAYFAGLWPSIAAAIASGLAAWFFFLPPSWSFALYPSTALVLALYGGVAAVMVAVIHVMNRTLDRLREEEARSAELARQREVLYAELRHRVANNLGIVSALLNLERNSVRDEKARQALGEAATRLSVIAKIQRTLHDPAGAEFRFGRFLQDLCRDVLEASGANGVECRVTAADMEIPAEKTVPLALIATELVSNALEHGFANAGGGTIRVDLAAEGEERVLSVSDNGKGTPEGFSLESAAGTGLRIVQALARQVEGQFAVILDGGGTTCRLVFPAGAVRAAEARPTAPAS